MRCNKCGKDNRDEALYCRYCGQEIAGANSVLLKEIVGMKEAKAILVDMMTKGQFVSNHEKSTGKKSNIGFDTIIMGNTGTGKTLLVETIGKILYKTGVTTKADPVIVDAVEWEGFSKNLEENVEEANGGILCIENVQKLVPDDYSNGIDALDSLFMGMDRWSKEPGHPIVILCGLPKGFREFLDKNPNTASKFEYKLLLPEPMGEELTQICERALYDEYGYTLEEEAKTKMLRIFKNIVKEKPKDWASGHTAIRLAENIFTNVLRRDSHTAEVLPQDIEGKEIVEKTPEDILAELDNFVGIDSVKSEVEAMIKNIECTKLKKGSDASISITNHYVFTGNPGTGKTTIARVFADVLKSLELLPIGQLIETDRSKLVGQYIGHTAVQTNEIIDSAIGGVLFIDEAYSLARGGSGTSDFGQEAIDTLLKRLEDDRGKFVCIVAGYTKEMQDFIASNPGIQSRFNKTIEFKDYNGPSMTEIFRRMVKKEKYNLDSEAEAKIGNYFERLYDSRTKDFGNARDVRNIFNKTIERQEERLSKIQDNADFDKSQLMEILLEDIPNAIQKEISEEECLKELDELVGLDGVKNEVRKLARYLKTEKIKADKLGKKFQGVRDHYLFLGNPGTGKTTVARIMANVFRSLGVTSKSGIIEVDRSKLISKFKGETTELVNKQVNLALGSILFVDEAYALKQGPQDDFGQEAIDTLLKRMEDDRGKFICIAAGYTKEMQEWIASNSGLESRFNKKIEFEDYDATSLAEIFRRKCKKEDIELSSAAELKMCEFFENLYSGRGRNFGNAREVNNVFQEVKEKQSERILDIIEREGDATKEQILTLEPEDFEI